MYVATVYMYGRVLLCYLIAILRNFSPVCGAKPQPRQFNQMGVHDLVDVAALATRYVSTYVATYHDASHHI